MYKNKEDYNTYMRKYYKKYGSNTHSKHTHAICVYYLPEHHYIGMTNNISYRMRKHKTDGNITEGYEILAYFERGVDAHYFETLLHMRGYNGFRDLRIKK